MKGRQMAVCGREKGYAKKFAEFANSRKDSLFAVHGFTDWDELTAYTKEHPVFNRIVSLKSSFKLPK